MAAGLRHDFYGRPVRIRVDVSPTRLRVLAGGLGALALLFLFGGAAMLDEDARGLVVLLCGVVLLPIAVWSAWGSFQAARREPLHVVLGLRKLRYPRGPVVWQMEEQDVRLADLRGVGVYADRSIVGVQLLVPDGDEVRRQVIQAAWLGGWSHVDLALLIELRIRGATQRLDPAQQAGLEALVFEGEGMLGAVVDTSKKKPTVLAMIRDLDAYEALLARKDFPHAKHKVVVASDQVDAVRDAIEARMLAAMDLAGFRSAPRR